VRTYDPFKIGDRVCLSKLGESRIKKPRSRAGRVVGFGSSEAKIRVLFDGLSQPTTLHNSYLIKEQEKQGEATLAVLPAGQSRGARRS
jgi:hypothetical protein